MASSTIQLIGNYLPDRQESMQRFLRMLTLGLQERGIAVNVLQPEPWAGKLRPSEHGLGKWLGYIDKFIIFPIVLRRTVKRLRRQATINKRQSPISDQRSTPSSPGFLVHICDHSSAHYTRYLRGIPHLVTCHDVLALRSARGDFPENSTKTTGRIYQKIILEGLKQAHHVACVSSQTQSELMEVANLQPTQTSLVPNGLNYPYAPLPIEDAQIVIQTHLHALNRGELAGQPFLLHVGGNQWYKNRHGLLKIFRELSLPAQFAPPLLFLIGKALPEELLSELPVEVSDRILQIGQLENAVLQAFYAAADLLVFPSKYEGFGWPIIEAQACGCRVATSDRAPMNEIGGTAAVYIDPERPLEAALKIQALLHENPNEREARIAAGIANAARYSMDRMIDGYLALYEHLLANRSAV